MKFEIKLGKIISPYFNSQGDKFYKGHSFYDFMSSYFVLVIVWKNVLPTDYGENGNEKKNVGPSLDILHKDYLISRVPQVDL